MGNQSCKCCDRCEKYERKNHCKCCPLGQYNPAIVIQTKITPDKEQFKLRQQKVQTKQKAIIDQFMQTHQLEFDEPTQLYWNENDVYRMVLGSSSIMGEPNFLLDTPTFIPVLGNKKKIFLSSKTHKS
jgi:hypothetical protein